MSIELLCRPGAIAVLMYVMRNPGCGKTAPAYTEMGFVDHSKEARINEMIEYGLMEVDLHGRTKNRKILYLTLKGKEVSYRLDEIDKIIQDTHPFPRAS